MELLKKRLANLLCVKSIVTIVLTAVFAHMTVSGTVTGEQFLTVFTTVVAFYFGSQYEKRTAAATTTEETKTEENKSEEPKTEETAGK